MHDDDTEVRTCFVFGMSIIAQLLINFLSYSLRLPPVLPFLLASASSQWFWLLFDSDLTPAGKNLLDGAYACFGYTTEGADFLKDVREGDIISKATIVSGKENLIMPK